MYIGRYRYTACMAHASIRLMYADQVTGSRSSKREVTGRLYMGEITIFKTV